MNKFSQKGMEVLEYKKELLEPSYTDLIKRALLSMTDQMLTNEVIDADVHFALKDTDTAYLDFEKLLLEKPGLLKTEDEMYQEYEVVRQRFDEKLRTRAIFAEESNLAKVLTESKVEDEQIHIISQFNIDASFIGRYFGAEGEELDKLMKRKGFAERFIVLRYNAMLANFLKGYEKYNPQTGRVEISEHLSLAAAPVYVNLDDSSYYSEFMIYVDVEWLEEEANHEEVMELVEKELKEVNDYIFIRTIV